MINRRHGAGVFAIAAVLASPAGAAPVLKNIMDWPGSYALTGFNTGLVRSGGEFFGIAVEKGRPPVDFGTVYRMTAPTGLRPKWHTSVIYDFATQNAPTPGEAYQARTSIAVDGSRNVYGFAQNNCNSAGSCAIIFELQAPASGSGPWTRTTLWSFQKTDRITYAGGVIIDGKGNLYGVGGNVRNDCPTRPDTCGGIFELSPNAARTSWTFHVIYGFKNADDTGVGLVLDKSGNLFFSTIPDVPDPVSSSITELSPPAEPGVAWTHTAIWHNKPGQQKSPTGLLFGPDGNLIVTAEGAYPDSPGGVFKLIRPATLGAKWTYKPVWSEQGSATIGYGASLPALIDGNGVLFVQGQTDFISLTPPAHLGSSWTAQEILQTTQGNDFYFGNRRLTFDSMGDIIFPSNKTAVYALQGSGFVPPHTTK